MYHRIILRNDHCMNTYYKTHLFKLAYSLQLYPVFHCIILPVSFCLNSAATSATTTVFIILVFFFNFNLNLTALFYKVSLGVLKGAPK